MATCSFGEMASFASLASLASLALGSPISVSPTFAYISTSAFTSTSASLSLALVWGAHTQLYSCSCSQLCAAAVKLRRRLMEGEFFILLLSFAPSFARRFGSFHELFSFCLLCSHIEHGLELESRANRDR